MDKRSLADSTNSIYLNNSVIFGSYFLYNSPK